MSKNLKMKKAIFICKNVDNMSAEEILLTERLSRFGFNVRNHETLSNNPLDLEIIGCDIIIISTDKENGFPPIITTDKKASIKNGLFFEMWK